MGEEGRKGGRKGERRRMEGREKRGKKRREGGKSRILSGARPWLWTVRWAGGRGWEGSCQRRAKPLESCYC